MALPYNALEIRGPEYFLRYPNGETFYLGQLLLRENIEAPNVTIIFENMPPNKILQYITFHRLHAFNEVPTVCCCINNYDIADIIQQEKMIFTQR